MNKNAIIKIIRVSVFAILLLMFVSSVLIVEYVDNIRARKIFFVILCFAELMLMIKLLKEPKYEEKRFTILDFLSIVFLIGLLMSCERGILQQYKIQTTFNGNNGFVCAYGESIWAEGYDDIEEALEYQIESKKEITNQNELEEIYRIQVGAKIYIYLELSTQGIIELDFFRQNDLYYISGSNILTYDGIFSSDRYTVEETIRKDIAHTMWRGVNPDEMRAPAWGVSEDEQICSMTVNSAKVDDVIEIGKKDGTKYYFWIITDIEDIKTIDDVKEAKIEMNGL